ncbi:putative ATP-dependent RNA helicase [Plasmodium gaboni]|uniref:ATP-dependent RNA helicase n=1 Tax=Plasmodium gaboni TaxID=647221 RepID=A0A151LA81_9APIC|nr:putative ATP-dependent RNA helicase [Plasmodium gaboni]KYN95797.1 putative ATP-dependent RNA helicase [Plasmodium gaboni]
MGEEEKKKHPFDELKLDESIIFSLYIQKYFFCANIQKKTIPPLINKENVLLHSQTGSGKTLCFVIPILQHLINHRNKLYPYDDKFIKKNELLNKKSVNDTVAYNKDQIERIYKSVENINIEKKNAYIDVDIDIGNFLLYTHNMLRNTNQMDISKKVETNQNDNKTMAYNEPTSDNQVNIIKKDEINIQNNNNNNKEEYIRKDDLKNITSSTTCNGNYKDDKHETNKDKYKEINTHTNNQTNKSHNINGEKKKKKKLLNVQAIIITPTRELCIQIYNLLNKFLFFLRFYISHTLNNNIDDNNILTKENFFINCLLFRGAVKISEDIKIIENEILKNERYQIIISTPGKLCSLLNEYNNKYFNTKELTYFVLDEGDKLLEDSYISYMENIIKNIETYEYTTCICSATCLQEENVYNLFQVKKKNFIKCINTDKKDNSSNVINTYEMPDGIENYYIILRNIDKALFLFKFLNTIVNDNETVIIFFPTCLCVEFFFHLFKNIFNTPKKGNKQNEHNKNIDNISVNNNIDYIFQLNSKYNNIFSDTDMANFIKLICYMNKYIGEKKNNFNFLKIHRKMKDKKRVATYNKIINTYVSKKNTKNKEKGNINNEKKIIFCTDIISRGINMDIHWVINYDVANKNMTYIHRSGRTGRFDKTGKNIIFLNKEEKEYIYFLKNKNVHVVNFKKTNMFQHMINFEKTLLESEDIINKDALQMIENNENEKKIKIRLNKNSFFNIYPQILYDKKHIENDKKENIQIQKGEQTKKNINNLLILNKKLVMFFLKYITFFVIENREIYLLSTKAFLSYIEFYKNHQLKFIFSFNKLNLTHLCYAFSLIKIPKFKEKSQIKNFQKINIQSFQIPYKNQEKEKKRQEHLKEKKIDITTQEQKKKGNEIKMQKKKKRKTIVQRKHEQREIEENEIDSLFYEENLYKKLKKKKITKDEYDRLLNMDDIDKMFSSTSKTSKYTNLTNSTHFFKSNRKKSKKRMKTYNIKIKKNKRKKKKRSKG